MVIPTFEEKTYEQAFNNELVVGVRGARSRLLSPGARLEATLGFDAMADLGKRHPAWRAIGRSHRAGVSVHDQAPTKLPDATFNLFIQYKRSHWIGSPRATHHQYFEGPYFRFHFHTPAQQLTTLHALARSSGSHAHVIYAAPEFHTIEQLWDANLSGEVIARSIVIDALRLSGSHKAFNFKTGYTSIQNPEPEEVEDHPADEWFADLEGEPRPIRDTLAIARGIVRGVPYWAGRWERDRVELLGPEPLNNNPEVAELMEQFAEVAAFAWMHGLTWRLSAPTDHDSVGEPRH